jgi:hypothetical protein
MDRNSITAHPRLGHKVGDAQSPESFPLLRNPYRHLVRSLKKIKKESEAKLLQLRWVTRRTLGSELVTPVKDDALSAVSIRVINLDRRSDRLENFSHEMRTLGIEQWTRISGVDGKSKYVNLEPFFAGSIACTESHIEALSLGKAPAAAAVMVCEDDLEFLVSREEIATLIAEFLANRLLSVLCLSGRVRGGSFSISKNLKVGMGIVGRGCYIAKPHAIQPLVRSFAEGIPALTRGRASGKGDRKWRKLQRRGYFFASPRHQVAQQGRGYSDIEGVELGPR